ncbi:unnamed protein product [Caenorhabditis auriculariae]|uniref:Serine/threonine-protein phosphatase n=1 Tax=Caenorhabditis auriculariae TaxID=2777116 RepID=A0A8S1GV54_9PELO|nr:unnamed protein product [Caenorhabditis auriculariae]
MHRLAPVTTTPPSNPSGDDSSSKIPSPNIEFLSDDGKKSIRCSMPQKTVEMLKLMQKRIRESKPTTPHDKVIFFDELMEMCLRAREQMLIDPPLVEIEAPVFILGDLHGQLHDLLAMLEKTGRPPDKKFLFLGDYVDRGAHSIETISLLLCFKLLYPNRMYLLRGNHETRIVNRNYGFYDECLRKFNPQQGVHLWSMYQHVFNCLPFAARINKRVFCVHGGISEELYTFRQFSRIVRPTDVCDIGMLCDLIWADPSPTTARYAPSPRGISQIFGKTAVQEFCKALCIDVVCRAHQCVMEGYEMFADKRCITVFSAPCYCGEINNSAAILYINSRMEIRILKHTKKMKGKEPEKNPDGWRAGIALLQRLIADEKPKSLTSCSFLILQEAHEKKETREAENSLKPFVKMSTLVNIGRFVLLEAGQGLAVADELKRSDSTLTNEDVRFLVEMSGRFKRSEPLQRLLDIAKFTDLSQKNIVSILDQLVKVYGKKSDVEGLERCIDIVVRASLMEFDQKTLLSKIRHFYKCINVKAPEKLYRLIGS